MGKKNKDKILITPNKSIFEINIKELWNYRYLLWVFVKRDFTSFYKQTLLGPLWYLIQPLLTSFTFLIIFNKVAGISTEGSNPILFYLSGVIAWEYFSNCLVLTSGTFINNSGLFGKVYFPRLIIPASIVISSLSRFFIQL